MRRKKSIWIYSSKVHERIKLYCNFVENSNRIDETEKSKILKLNVTPGIYRHYWIISMKKKASLERSKSRHLLAKY